MSSSQPVFLFYETEYKMTSRENTPMDNLQLSEKVQSIIDILKSVCENTDWTVRIRGYKDDFFFHFYDKNDKKIKAIGGGAMRLANLISEHIPLDENEIKKFFIQELSEFR